MPITSLALLAQFLALPLALQAAPVAPAETAPSALADIADLPIAEATAPRCGIAFATVEGWQEVGDTRGMPWPDMASSGGREFFVVAMVQLIDRYGLERDDVQRLVELEVNRHVEDNGEAVMSMMPGCLLLLERSGVPSAQ